MRTFLLALFLLAFPLGYTHATDTPPMPQVVMGQVIGPGPGMYRPVPEGIHYLYSAARIAERIKEGKFFIDVYRAMDVENCTYDDKVMARVNTNINEIIEIVRYYSAGGCRMVVSFIKRSDLRPLTDLPTPSIQR